MDPTATWDALQRELMAENWEQATELAESLLTWLGRDGFPPLIGSKDLPYGWHRALAEAGAKYVLMAAGGESADEAAEREEGASHHREMGT